MVGARSAESPGSPSIELNRDPERRLQDIAAQQEFIGIVENLRSPAVVPLPDLSDFLDHETARTKGLDVQLEGSEDRVFLAPRFFEYINSDRFPNRLSFRAQPLLRMGREDSFHQAFFGSLNAQWFHEATQESVQIAVKPIPQRSLPEERLLHEVAMYQYLPKLEIPTLEMLGVCMLKEPRNKLAGFVITRFDPELVTLDTLNWASIEQEERLEYVGLALDTLALLHSHLIFHGDPGFKNIALGEANKSITAVDLEWATSGKDIAGNILRLKQQMANDFTVLENSVNSSVLVNLPPDEKPLDDVDRFNALHNLVFEPYFERLVHIDSPYLDSLAKAYELMIEEKARFARGE